MPASIRARVFYMIRHHDVELAETYAHRCPEVNDVTDLNMFFHRIFGQFSECTHHLRSRLDDTLTVDQWLFYFERDILPELRRLRFPACTAKEVPPLYEVFSQGTTVA